MRTNEIIQEIINLKPQEKYLIIESLILSLNEPDILKKFGLKNHKKD